MPEFEEWSREEGESKENDVGQASEKNQARYALKRGRIPQVKNFTENGEAAVTASIIDVEHDAIGARSQGRPVSNVPPVKKSTEIVEEVGDATSSDRRSHSHQKTIRREHEQKSKFHGGKIQTHDRVILEKHPPTKSEGKLAKFWKKFLKFFGIKSKTLENAEGNQNKRHTAKRTSNFRTQGTQNNFSKKAK
ncbi:MAG: hypothetical protein LBF49_00370 [Puniceicoccales bacterium]|jgi:hypothetical protein|nr:hypothetical protein [Puniceicoccales bacterium]